MPTYTVLVTVELFGESEHEAYGFIRHALDSARKAEIRHLDSEVVGTRSEDDEDDGSVSDCANGTCTENH